MSRLEFYARPLVAFDPTNKDHRRYYHQFVEYGGWGKCPVRFICPDSVGYDLTIMIRNQLIEYYVKKEFGKSAAQSTTKIRPKRQKMVDRRPK